MVFRSLSHALSSVSQINAFSEHAALVSKEGIGSLKSPTYKLVPSMSMPAGYSSKPKPDHIEGGSATSLSRNYGFKLDNYSQITENSTNQAVNNRLEEKINHVDSMISVPEIPNYRNRLNYQGDYSSFVMEDGEVYTSFNVGMDGLPIVCNSKGCRPLSESERKRMWDINHEEISANYTNKDCMEDYYTKLLAENGGHSNPLLLRNFAHFLHEVQGDYTRAKEYYERAILANPSDGEVSSQYAKLLWDVHGDRERAGTYLERAVQAAPDDCHVLGCYASFLWNTEEVGDDDNNVWG